MKKLIVVYKLGVTCNGALSAGENIKVHELHAQANGGKVLFTIGKFPSPKNRDYVKEIILMTKNGDSAIRADIQAMGKYEVMNPPEGFTVPSIWANEDKTKFNCWFALSNLKSITIRRGDFQIINGNDLIDGLSGNAYMVYVEE